jgi:hypothetical protein
MATGTKANGRSTPELTGLNAIDEVNDGAVLRPFIVACTVEGTTDFLSHRYSVDSVASKGKAAKGSAEKKSDDTESYVYRNDDGLICIPGRYPQRAIVEAARFHQDPRSPAQDGEGSHPGRGLGRSAPGPHPHGGQPQPHRRLGLFGSTAGGGSAFRCHKGATSIPSGLDGRLRAQRSPARICVRGIPVPPPS